MGTFVEFYGRLYVYMSPIGSNRFWDEPQKTLLAFYDYCLIILVRYVL